MTLKWFEEFRREFRVKYKMKPKLLRLVEKESGRYSVEEIVRILQEKGEDISFEEIDDLIYEMRGFASIILNDNGKLEFEPPYREKKLTLPPPPVISVSPLPPAPPPPVMPQLPPAPPPFAMPLSSSSALEQTSLMREMKTSIHNTVMHAVRDVFEALLADGALNSRRDPHHHDRSDEAAGENDQQEVVFRRPQGSAQRPRR